MKYLSSILFFTLQACGDSSLDDDDEDRLQGGNTYNLYYMPNDGSPYPRDFIINQDGIIEYANNEIDTAWMLSIIDGLLSGNCSDWELGDINNDNMINILDIVNLINYILGS